MERLHGEEEVEESLEHPIGQLKQQGREHRKHIINALVRTRNKDWEYIQQVFEGGYYWLNAYLLTRDDIITAFSNEGMIDLRCEKYFFLGLSLGKILEEYKTLTGYVTAGLQVMEEWEYYFSPPAIQSMRSMVAKNSDLYPKEKIIKEESLFCPFRPSLYKWNNQKIIYHCFCKTTMCIPMDLCEVIIALCAVLNLFYVKFQDVKESENEYLFQAIMQFDKRIKTLFIDRIERHLTAYVRSHIDIEFNYIMD